MASREFLVPGVGFVNIPDAGEREYLIPGGGFINEGEGGVTALAGMICTPVGWKQLSSIAIFANSAWRPVTSKMIRTPIGWKQA